MKIAGIILIVIGTLSLLGSLGSSVAFEPQVRIMGFIIQIAMIIGGSILISKSSIKNTE